MMVTVNGLIEGTNQELDWHVVDSKYHQYNDQLFQQVDTFLFGRVTYQHMESFWQSSIAYEKFPNTAERMNQNAKLVISNTLKQVNWQNTRLINGNDLEKRIKQLKEKNGKDMLVLGSLELVSVLTAYGLVDEYHLIINPVALVDGKRLWSEISRPIVLELIDSRVFHSGNVLLRYQPSDIKYEYFWG